MFWKILKIEPTSDRNRIRSAYRELLAVTNPEDKPEEFKQLRQAYEDALAYAAEHEVSALKTPIEQWQDDLSALYDDFRRRNDLSEWQKLLNADVCLSVDSRMECEDLLIRFLMEHYFITHDVWVYFDEQFSWLERQEELYETYPRDFIDYVIASGIHFEDTLLMDLFEPGTDGEAANQYLGLYLKAVNQETEDLKPVFDEMLALPEQHPYGNALWLSWRLREGDEAALDELRDLQKKYPASLHVGLALAEELLGRNLYDECLQLSEKLAELDKDNIRRRWFEANATAGQGRYQDAVKIIDAMLRDTAGNGELQYTLDQKRSEWNKVIIEELSKKLADDPDDQEARFDLCWALLENNRMDEADEAASLLPEDYEDRFGYFNLKGSLALGQGRYEEAAGLLEKLAEIAAQLPADTEKNISRRRRVGETWTRVGFCYYSLKNMEKADEAYQKALATSEDKTEILVHLSENGLTERNWDKTLEYCRELAQVAPGNYRAFLMMAYAYYYKRFDREAFNAVNRAMDLYRSDINLYTLKARILIRNEAADAAQEIIDFLVQSGVGEDPGVLFVQGVLQEDAKQDYSAAQDFYEKALAGMSGQEENYEFGAEMLYRLLCLKGEKLDAYVTDDREIMLDLAERGLKCNPDHYGLKDYKAWLLVRGNQYDEAMAIYQDLLNDPYHTPNVEAEIGYIYYQDLEHKADQALKYYLMSLEKGGRPSGHFYAGMCYMYMFRPEEAREQFELLKEKNPNSIDSWYRLSSVYGMQGKLEEALAEINHAVEMASEREGDQSGYFLRKATILRRMKRYDEAIEVLREVLERYDYKYARRIIFMVYAHAGRLEEAEAFLKEWAAVDEYDRELCDCEILLHMYRKDFDKASLQKKMVRQYLHPDRALEVDHILSEYYGDYKKQLKELLKWEQFRKERDGFDMSRIQGAIAMCYFRLHDLEMAQEYARTALVEIDRKLSEFEPDKLLFMARKIRLLAILGRKEEALALADACKNHPFCMSCPEQTCKDTDIFRMEAEEIFGNYQKAYEIACECQSMYPDEEDFLIAEHNLKRKVK
ncbi:MAG: tetratricopeptide repeat protein [Solobacterium sp.]|nr:tetratricopeptide repeat protein [Solobacterium sp.]